MNEWYYSLKTGENKEQYGTVLRLREGELEELTGFLTLKKVGETAIETYYEANINVDGYGKPLGKEDIIGLNIREKDLEVEILKKPSKEAKITRISMSKAAKILEEIQSMRNTLAWIYD